MCIRDSSIDECPTAFYELQRYNYDEENKDSKEEMCIRDRNIVKHRQVREQVIALKHHSYTLP